MFIDTKSQPHEDRVLAAWDDYAAKRAAAEAAMSDPALHRTQRMATHTQAQDAYQRFVALFVAPTPEELRLESGRLFAEGFGLLMLVCGFVALFLPDLLASFWPLAITFTVCAGLGGWAVHYLGRLGRHIGRRM